MNMPMWPRTLSPGSSVPHHHHPEIYHDNTFPPITVILTAFLLALFFLGFFAIYFCRCVLDGIFSAFNNRHPPPGIPIAPANPEPPGLEPSIINTFPTFSYSSVKDYRRENYGLECAICLCEFEDEDILRLLTKCCHVFHQPCIDLWLGSHISCPVCRCLLDPSDEKSPEKPVEMTTTATQLGDGDDNHTSIQDETSMTTVEIVIKGDEEGSCSSSSNIGVATTSSNAVNDGEVQPDETLKAHNSNDHNKMTNITGVGRFSRSHSTGHSIGQRRMGIEKGVRDKYTLRLPQEVKERITRRHMQTLSCTTFGAVYENDESGWVGQIYNGGGFGGEISRENIN